jgi:hypothetical protein
MTDLDDVLSMAEAADLIGRTPGAMSKAAYRGTLEAKLVHGKTWITTRTAVTRYAARVAAQRRVRKPTRTIPEGHR